MKSADLKKIISQLKKYELTKEFYNTQEFDNWLLKLNNRQIKNFKSLIIDSSIIKFPKKILINENLLDCDDYNARLNSLLKLKNWEGCQQLFDRLCSKNFLNSKKFYKDIDIISKADTARYALSVINEDVFINSKYHDEDLKLIVEAKDSLVAEALASVAKDADSIKSPYHQKDMELIASSGSKCLQMIHSYPQHSINYLAINKVSLSDKYHLENMQILSKKPLAAEYLYNIMTDPDIIKGKTYRDEVNALLNAKSKITAIAIYNFIVNPKDKCIDDLCCCGLDFSNVSIIKRYTNVKGNLSPKYLEYLKLFNKVEDKFVVFISSIISNKYLINSPYLEYDLNLLLSIKDEKIFFDLYDIMTDEISLSGLNHIKDVTLISKTVNERIRKLLLTKASNEDSINNVNHEYDMQYIAKLNLDCIDEEIQNKMYYYLFTYRGINHVEHIDRLVKLYSGEKIEDYDVILEHLNNLEKKSDLNFNKQNINIKVLSKIKRIFKI